MNNNQNDWCCANSISVKTKWLLVNPFNIKLEPCEVCGTFLRVQFIDCGGYHKNERDKLVSVKYKNMCLHPYILKHRNSKLSQTINKLDTLFNMVEEAKRKLYQEK